MLLRRHYGYETFAKPVKMLGAAMALLAFGAATTGLGGAAIAPASAAPKQPPACARLKLTVSPVLNAQNLPYETATHKVTSCARVTETATVVQKVPGLTGANRWKVTLRPGQSVTKVRHIPYSCCGTYTVFDKVYARSGAVLDHAEATFIFA